MNEESIKPKLHSLGKSLVLQLAPGALLTMAFLVIAPMMIRSGGSNSLSLIL